MKLKAILTGTALTLLAACGGSNDETILPGERLGHRTGFAGASSATVNRSVAVALPAAQSNASWTHRGGSTLHTAGHPALSGALQPLFAVQIGEGNSRRAIITADPVVAEGRVFTLDARSTVSAVSTGGQLLWQSDIVPLGVAQSDASGGGLAYGGGKLFVTSGYGRVTALDPASGAKLWEHDFNAPAGASPTYSNGMVYVVSRDGRGWVLEAANGRVKFAVSGTGAMAGLSGGAGVATDGTIAVFPFPSGELLATYANGGMKRWSSYVAGRRLGDATSAVLTDVASDPVIAGGRLYAANVSGEIAAFDLATGSQIWSQREGAIGPLSVIGGSVFFMSDRNTLVRLDAGNGAVVWKQALPLFVDEKPKKFSDRYAHFGPVLAGGRLIVASSDGLIRTFDPASGASLGQVALEGGAASGPVVAGGTLYITTADGRLRAFR